MVDRSGDIVARAEDVVTEALVIRERGCAGEALAVAAVPDLALGTDVIVGFPGEGEADYKELEAFITAAKIDWLGVFTYSDEEGAKAFELADELKIPTRTI